MTGIMKSICVKEMTLLLFSFRHRSFAMVFNVLVMAFWMSEIESEAPLQV